MKKIIAVLISVFILLGGNSVALGSNIKVTLNGREIAFDQPPVLDEETNRVLVPVRAIFEALGADVYWIEEDEVIIGVKDNIKVILCIGFEEMFILDLPLNTTVLQLFDYAENNPEKFRTIILDSVPVILNGRALVPVRAISEALNAAVRWDSAASTVVLESNSTIAKNTDTKFIDTLLRFVEILESNVVNGNIKLTDSDGAIVLDNEDICSAKADYIKDNENNGQYCIFLTLTPEGTRKFSDATHIISQKTDGQNYISIIYDDRLISRPTVSAPIDSEEIIITGNFTKESAEELANLINYGE